MTATGRTGKPPDPTGVHGRRWSCGRVAGSVAGYVASRGRRSAASCVRADGQFGGATCWSPWPFVGRPPAMRCAVEAAVPCDLLGQGRCWGRRSCCLVGHVMPLYWRRRSRSRETRGGITSGNPVGYALLLERRPGGMGTCSISSWEIFWRRACRFWSRPGWVPSVCCSCGLCRGSSGRLEPEFGDHGLEPNSGFGFRKKSGQNLPRKFAE